MLSVKPKRGDILIITAVLGIAVVFFLAARLFLPGATGEKVMAKLRVGDSEEVLSLEKDRTIEVESNGFTLSFEIRDGTIRVVSSDCPEKCCERAGKIGKGRNGVILCLPAEVMVTIAGEEAPDAFSY